MNAAFCSTFCRAAFTSSILRAPCSRQPGVAEATATTSRQTGDGRGPPGTDRRRSSAPGRGARAALPTLRHRQDRLPVVPTPANNSAPSTGTTLAFEVITGMNDLRLSVSKKTEKRQRTPLVFGRNLAKKLVHFHREKPGSRRILSGKSPKGHYFFLPLLSPPPIVNHNSAGNCTKSPRRLGRLPRRRFRPTRILAAAPRRKNS